MAVYLGSNEVNLRGGQPMENGLPSGGLTGQVLAKSSNDDYVAAWTTVYDVPAGGSAGQVLAKSSDDDYALTWTSIENDPALPSGGLNGQVLAKSSNDDYAVAWSTLPPGEFVITVTQTSTSGSGTFSMNRTTGQIKTAIESGQHVVVYFRFTAYSQFGEPGDRRRFPYKQTAYGYYEFENDFIDINSGSTKLCSYLFKISTSSGAISLTRNSAYGVAAGNSNYVGKFLGAVAGAAVPVYPEWQTIYQVPAGGSNGQFLKKTGSGLADYAWASVPSGLPSGGTAGQVLKKNSATNYDVSWGDAGGGGLFVATFSDSGNNIVCDKDEVEVHDAAEAGTPIIGIYNGIILSCDYEEFIDNWSGYFRGYQYLANGTVRSIEIYLAGGCSLSTTYKPLKYDGHFRPSQNEFVLNTSARDYHELYDFFDINKFGECVACVTVDGITREFSCAQRENEHDEDLDEWVFLARFTCSEVVENSGVYELHVFSFDSEQYHTNPSTIVVKNYAEKKVVLSAV